MVSYWFCCSVQLMLWFEFILWSGVASVQMADEGVPQESVLGSLLFPPDIKIIYLVTEYCISIVWWYFAWQYFIHTPVQVFFLVRSAAAMISGIGWCLWVSHVSAVIMIKNDDWSGMNRENFKAATNLSIVQLVLWSIKYQKNCKKCWSIFHEAKVTSSSILFCPQPEDIHFTFIGKQEGSI